MNDTRLDEDAGQQDTAIKEMAFVAVHDERHLFDSLLPGVAD